MLYAFLKISSQSPKSTMVIFKSIFDKFFSSSNSVFELVTWVTVSSVSKVKVLPSAGEYFGRIALFNIETKLEILLIWIFWMLLFLFENSL